MKKTPIDAYIRTAPEEHRGLLEKLRQAIAKAAPEAAEVISYGIPTFDLHGQHLVHFAMNRKHIGFYPTPSAIDAFADSFQVYHTSKGAVQFPLDKAIPYALVKRVVAFRVKEVKNMAKTPSDKRGSAKK